MSALEMLNLSVISLTLLRIGNAAQLPDRFSGAAALEATRQATAFGERYSGSDANAKLREWIVSEIKPLPGEISLDSFTGQTPTGPIPMTNIIVSFPGSSGQAIAVTGHFDTKHIPMVHFVGANDAGSSTGFLIEFARVVAKIKHPDTIYIVFFDGEEDLVNWTATDSVYGSRHLAAKWGGDGTLSKLRYLINIDMIGDKQLDLANDDNSSSELRVLFGKIAAKQGNSKYFRTDHMAIDDDHKPFADAGVNVIDVIDLDYGPNNAYWHTAQDTMDKLSAHSLQVVGDVVLESVRELEQTNSSR
ncbi:MAG TPA: M28 family peptidase [Bryobacteraceae bacterium]|jgi:Zn-dependent M28 family amino/carboxypeptidase|nr:M28 family peptidase [Bryobacteraceae bacterium]